MNKFRSQYIPESVLIVVSILIAFAIDAWWEEQQEREQETRILKALRMEFQENADRLPLSIRSREQVARHATDVVEQVQAAGAEGKVTMTPEQLMLLTVHQSFEATSGAFDAMLQSGDLRFIQSQELQQRLVQWPRLVSDAVENDYHLRTIAGPRAFEYLAEYVDLGYVDQIVRCKFDPANQDCPQVRFELEATPRLSGIASHVSGWSSEGAVELELVRQEALDLVRILGEELGEN